MFLYGQTISGRILCQMTSRRGVVGERYEKLQQKKKSNAPDRDRVGSLLALFHAPDDGGWPPKEGPFRHPCLLAACHIQTFRTSSKQADTRRTYDSGPG